ncbi:hypothetical protein [Neorhizobium galegae]|uniref:Uncharacterized protein n=1 Tax=Neorhizobium galegae bv. orientalis str. HAMBI 540 TaxID=1028800 RepID=A0A068SM53_NEOGA|nr:hypothetical protein [Neorhizobium galegae]MCQ1856386.1 hypothetical protein [Neorhizobium galegae]CDN46831.1 Hypothetical protein RG540_CH06410 [Neorhizobium galegae bv. orientalis str. HAMBI 540]
MAAAEHIRTQVRKGVKAHLAAAVGDLNVHYASRIVRSFQSDNFPLVLVAVTDIPRASADPSDPIVERDVTVSIKISERTAFEDVEDRVDGMCLRIEKALVNPGDLGFGKYWGWKIGATSAPELDPLSEDTLLMSVVMPITFTLATRDTDPGENINP